MLVLKHISDLWRFDVSGFQVSSKLSGNDRVFWAISDVAEDGVAELVILQFSPNPLKDNRHTHPALLKMAIPFSW